MFFDSYKRAFGVLAKKPFVLWGLSLMSALLVIVATVMFGLIPGVGIAISYLLVCGMSKIYLDGLMGKAVYSDQLFVGFSKNCFRIIGAMAWKDLWILIWALIPIAGPIIAVVKSYSYCFVPYIIVTYPNVKATEALRISKKLTNGLKTQMFLADLCIAAIAFGVFFILGLLAIIPILGILFGLALFVLYILVIAVAPVFAGLYKAYFFEVCGGVSRTQAQPPVQHAPVNNQPNYVQANNQPNIAND